MRVSVRHSHVRPTRSRAVTRIGREAALTVGAVLGTVCIAVLAAGAILGVRPLVVESGSMSPTIEAGSIAFARPAAASELRTGDVVSVETATGSRVMHRITSIETDGGQAELTLRGDANQQPDDETYRVEGADRVFLSVPLLGYAAVWLSGPFGLLCVGGLALIALLSLWRPRAGAARGSAAALAAVAVLVGSVGVATRPTMAFFTDTAAARSGVIGSHTVAPPASAECSSNLLQATVSWPADPRYDYEVVLRRVSDDSVVSTRDVTGSNDSTTYTGLSDFGLVVGAGQVDFRVEITSILAGASTWKSSTVTTYSAIRVLAIVVGGTATCQA